MDRPGEPDHRLDLARQGHILFSSLHAKTPGFVVRVRAEEAGLIAVVITDSKGNFVEMVSGRYEKAGDYFLFWDGLDREGNPCPKGVYSYQILGSSTPGTRGVIPIR